MATRNGNGGTNFLFGTFGADDIFGRGGNDFLFGFFGNDNIRGGNGNDWMFGGGGRDRIAGGNGDDIGFGGSGNDRMIGGRGSDVMFGGSGNDTFVYRAERNVGEEDYYSGGSGNDRLVLRLNADEAADQDIQADIAAFEAFLAAGGGGDYTFSSLGLTVNSIERLIVRAPEPEPNENNAPTASPLTLSASDEDVVRTISAADLLANVTDADGDTLTISGPVTVLSQNASVELTAEGYVVTPDTNDDSEVVLSYSVSDGQASVETTATFDLNPVNDAPVAEDATLTVSEDGSMTFFPGQNSSDVDGDDLDVSFDGEIAGLLIGGDFGEITFETARSYDFLSEGDTLEETFTYTVSDGLESDTGTVTVTVEGVNDAPIARNDGDGPIIIDAEFNPGFDTIRFGIGVNDGTLDLPVLLNDIEVDQNDTLMISALDVDENLASRANIQISEDGQNILFNPNNDFFFGDGPVFPLPPIEGERPIFGLAELVQFDYTVTDDKGASDTATVFVEVFDDGFNMPV